MKISHILFVLVITAFAGCRSHEEVNPKPPVSKNPDSLCTLPRPALANTKDAVNGVAATGITVGGCVVTDSLIFNDSILPPSGQVPGNSSVDESSQTFPYMPSGIQLRCSNPDRDEADPFPGTSNCIEQKINEFNRSCLICANASVSEYIFQGQSVFLFSPGSCLPDLQYFVYDSNCQPLGNLAGIAGLTQINGENFSSNAVFVNTIWTK
jgi:hypothetical protein